MTNMTFLLQDNIWTEPSFKLSTTCGAWAFKDSVAKANSDVVQTVRIKIGLSRIDPL